MKKITLYRYLSASSALKSLEGMRLRIGRLATLNDPFDCAPQYRAPTELDRITCEAIGGTIIQSINNQVGLICFSRVWDEPVLWSHYADSHKGITLEFEKKNGPDLWRVTYSKTRTVIEYNDLRDRHKQEQVSAAVLDFFRVKSPTWRYEKEVRMLHHLPKCLAVDGFYYIGIEERQLKGVILGLKCEIDSNYIKSILKARNLEHVKVWRAIKSKSEFRIEKNEA